MAKENSKKITIDDYRQKVAEKFIEVLSMNDKIPWYQGWYNPFGGQISGATGKKYKGLNLVYLTMTARILGYEDPRWYTFAAVKGMNNDLLEKAKAKDEELPWDKQIHLIKGSEGVRILDTYPKKKIYDEDGNFVTTKRVLWSEFYKDYAEDAEKAYKDYYVANREVVVFNGDQIVNLPKMEVKLKDITTSEIVKSIAENMGVPIYHDDDSDRAYYIPDDDEIHLPPEGTFKSEKALNATTLHELAHSTGHKSRLNRDQTGYFGSNSYAYEELIAEMASAMMGLYEDDVIDDREMQNHQAYIQSWIKDIKEKPQILDDAIKEALRASDYMDEHISKELLQEHEIEVESKNTISDHNEYEVVSINDPPLVKDEDKRYRDPVNAFEAAINRGMKDPDKWLYTYSHDNYDYFESKDGLEQIRYAEYPLIEMIRRKVYNEPNEGYLTHDEYIERHTWHEEMDKYELPKGYEPWDKGLGGLDLYEAKFYKDKRDQLEEMLNSREYNDKLLQDELVRKEIENMANDEVKKMDEKTEWVNVNIPKFKVRDAHVENKIDPNRPLAWVDIPNEDGSYGYPIRSFLVPKDRVKDDQKHPESRCYISFVKGKDLTVYRSKLEGNTFIQEGTEKVSPEAIKDAFKKNYEVYLENRQSREKDFEDANELDNMNEKDKERGM